MPSSPNITQNWWQTYEPACVVDKARGYITLPAFNIDYSAIGSSQLPLIIGKYNFNSPNKFTFSTLPTMPAECNFVLGISFTKIVGSAPARAAINYNGGEISAGNYNVNFVNIGSISYIGDGSPVYGVDYSINTTTGILTIYAPYGAGFSYWEFNSLSFLLTINPQDNRTITTTRYKLWTPTILANGSIDNTYFPLYAGQSIEKNFAFEVWGIDTVALNAQLNNSTAFATSVRQVKTTLTDNDTISMANSTLVPRADLLQTSIYGVGSFALPLTFKSTTVQSN